MNERRCVPFSDRAFSFLRSVTRGVDRALSRTCPVRKAGRSAVSVTIRTCGSDRNFISLIERNLALPVPDQAARLARSARPPR
jgi:hypothetical protein